MHAWLCIYVTVDVLGKGDGVAQEVGIKVTVLASCRARASIVAVNSPKHALPSPFELLLVVVSVVDMLALMVSSAPGILPPVAAFLRWLDFAVCGVFMVDFCVRFARSPNKLSFMRWGWVDLVASIPQVGVLRIGRVFRVVRLVRVLRAVRSTRVLAAHLWSYRGRHVLAAVAGLSMLVTVFAAVAILQFEHGDVGNIHTAGDALWWAFTTVTTVGYGDRYPVTWEGRCVAAGLMIVGVGLFGSFTAFVARLFVAPELRQENDELALMRVELRALHEDLRTLHAELRTARQGT